MEQKWFYISTIAIPRCGKETVFFSKCLLGILLANRYLYKFYYFLATDYTQIMQ